MLAFSFPQLIQKMQTFVLLSFTDNLDKMEISQEAWLFFFVLLFLLDSLQPLPLPQASLEKNCLPQISLPHGDECQITQLTLSIFQFGFNSTLRKENWRKSGTFASLVASIHMSFYVHILSTIITRHYPLAFPCFHYLILYPPARCSNLLSIRCLLKTL